MTEVIDLPIGMGRREAQQIARLLYSEYGIEVQITQSGYFRHRRFALQAPCFSAAARRHVEAISKSWATKADRPIQSSQSASGVRALALAGLSAGVLVLRRQV